MSVLSFKPKNVTKRLVAVLPDRACDVVVSRFGLGKTPDKMTLESIGQKYGITRERVRQIENHALSKVRQSEQFEDEQAVFEELQEIIESLGGIISEEELLSHVSSKPEVQNHVYLFLTLGDQFVRHKEDDHFVHRWHVNSKIADVIHGALHKLHDALSHDDLVPEEEIIENFTQYVSDLDHPGTEDADVVKRWLNISKVIDRNPLGAWGLASSPNVRVKGMRDYAYLVIRDHGGPMHFSEVTNAIERLFDKNAHVATTHNELIKDKRFVLVGRGLYALSEWGYMRGVVKDVIRQILEQHGPMTRDEIVDQVLKERYVKPNTVIVNLQNNDEFVRQADGTYKVA